MFTGLIVLVLFVAFALFLRRFFGGRKSARSSGCANPQNLPDSTDTIELVKASFREREYNCGHAGPKKFVVSAYGVKTREIEEEGRCPKCFIAWIEPLIARCCLCRLPIFPGDAVALYSGAADFQTDIAKRVNGQWMGCMRWDCCPTGGFFAGHWTGKEFKSAFKGGSMVGEVLRTGKPVVANTDGEVHIVDSDKNKEEDSEPEKPEKT